MKTVDSIVQKFDVIAQKFDFCKLSLQLYVRQEKLKQSTVSVISKFKTKSLSMASPPDPCTNLIISNPPVQRHKCPWELFGYTVSYSLQPGADERWTEKMFEIFVSKRYKITDHMKVSKTENVSILQSYTTLVSNKTEPM